MLVRRIKTGHGMVEWPPILRIVIRVADRNVDQRGSELSHPALLRFRDGALLGLCGEAFNPAGGVEGAYLSGLELAQRIAWDAATPADGQAARTTTD